MCAAMRLDPTQLGGRIHRYFGRNHLVLDRCGQTTTPSERIVDARLMQGSGLFTLRDNHTLLIRDDYGKRQSIAHLSNGG